LVLSILFSTSAHAYSVEKATLEWKGSDVKTISPTKSLSGATINVKLSSDYKDCFDPKKYKGKTCIVFVDAKAIGGGTYQLPIRDACKNTTGGYNCTTPDFTFSTTKESNTIKVYSQVDTKGTPVQSLNIPIILDTTTPKLVSIKTGYCEEEICYASGGLLTPVELTFSDTVSSFDYKMVFVGKKGATSTFTPDSCSGTTCKGAVALSCSDGERVTLQVKPSISVEDAMNAVDAAVTQVVECTKEAPKLLANTWRWSADGIAGQAVVGGKVTFTGTFQLAIGDTATGGVNTSNMTADGYVKAVCSPSGDTTDPTVQVCTWELSRVQAGKYDLRFRVYDQVGNYYEVPQNRFVVLNITTINKGEKGPDFFTVVPGKPSPEALSRPALELARKNYMPYPLYLPYSLKTSRADARVVHQKVTACWYRYANDTRGNYTTRLNLFAFGAVDGGLPESRVLYPNAKHSEPNRMDLQIRADPSVLEKADAFDAKCQLDLYVAVGDNIYSIPESENVTFPVKLRGTALGRPGQEFVTKMQEEQKSLNSSTAKLIRTAEKYRQQLDKVCRGAETVVQVQTALSAGKAVLMGVCSTNIPAARDAAAGANNAITSILNPANGVIAELWDGNIAPVEGGWVLNAAANTALQAVVPNNALLGGGGPVRIICRQVNCRATADMNTMGGTATGTDVGSFLLNELTANMNVMDPQASMTGAIGTMCLGGVVYNLQKYQAIDCNYLQCLKEQSTNAGNIRVCEQGRSYQMCSQVVGEFMELPFINMFKNLVQNANHMLKNLPMLAGKFGLMKACDGQVFISAIPKAATECYQIKIGWKAVACSLGNSVIGAIDGQKQSSQALQGIRDVEAAELALQLCEDAAAGKVTQRYTGAEEDQKFDINKVLIEGAVISDAYKAAVRDSPAKTFLMTEKPTGSKYLQCANGNCIDYTPDSHMIELKPGVSGLTGVRLVDSKGTVIAELADSQTPFGMAAVSLLDDDDLSTAAKNGIVGDKKKGEDLKKAITATNNQITGAPGKYLQLYTESQRLEGLLESEGTAGPNYEKYERQLSSVKLEMSGMKTDENNKGIDLEGFANAQYAFNNDIRTLSGRVDSLTAEANRLRTEASKLAPNSEAAAAKIEEAKAKEAAAKDASKKLADAQAVAAKNAAETATGGPDDFSMGKLSGMKESAVNLQKLITTQTAAYTTVEKLVESCTTPGCVIKLDSGMVIDGKTTLVREELVQWLKEQKDLIDKNTNDLSNQKTSISLQEAQIGLYNLQVRVAVAAAAEMAVKANANLKTTADALSKDAVTLRAQAESLAKGDPKRDDLIAQANQKTDIAKSVNACLASDDCSAQFMKFASGGPTAVTDPALLPAFEAIGLVAVKSEKSLDSNEKLLNDLGMALADKGEADITAKAEVAGALLAAKERENTRQRAEDAANDARAGLDMLTGYAAKIALEAGLLDWMQTAEWSQGLADFADEYVSIDGMKHKLCNERTSDLQDNDDGAIYMQNSYGYTNVAATFGSEMRVIENGTKNVTSYITAMSITNPTRTNYKVKVVFSDMKQCYISGCDKEHSLTNNVWYDLNASMTFGGGMRTRIDYLPAKYGKICVIFDKKFPDNKPNSKDTYCRPIKEDTLSGNTPYRPSAISVTSGGTTSTYTSSVDPDEAPPVVDPLGGWS